MALDLTADNFILGIIPPSASGGGGGGSGTVTSVDMTVPAFLTVSGNPITTSGTLTVAYSGTALPVLNGGTGGTTAALARTSLGTAASGANSDITSLTGLSTPLSVPQGGTGSTTAAAARTALGTAASGANADITSLTGLTTPLSAAQGGTATASAFTAVADAAYVMLGTDRSVVYTSLTATRAVTLPAANAVPKGVPLAVRDGSGNASGTINLVISRAGSDTIEGGTTAWTIRTPNGFRAFYSDGTSNWYLADMSEDIQIFTTTGAGTWTKEPGARRGYVEAVGGGGGGGSGAVEASATVACGGGGGAGAGTSWKFFSAADAGATESVTVGAGGTGGAAQASSNSNGNPGVSGTDSVFGTPQLVRCIAKGGANGSGGTTTTGLAGTAGAGLFKGNDGGIASTTGGGGAPGNGNPSGNSGGSGGAGGGIATVPAFAIGGHGGSGSVFRTDWGSAGSQGNARGSTDGASGNTATAGTTNAVIGGAGGGGGASSVLTNGGNGGGGAIYGGGGGGSGSALNTHSSGTGGAGANGIVIVHQGLQ